jgi:hypothetical protein
MNKGIAIVIGSLIFIAFILVVVINLLTQKKPETDSEKTSGPTPTSFRIRENLASPTPRIRISISPTTITSISPTITQSRIPTIVKNILPYEDDDIKIQYSPDLDKVVITEKTNQAVTKLSEWSSKNNAQFLQNTDNFILKSSQQNITPSQIQKLEELKKLGRYDTPDFSIRYDAELDMFIIERKTDIADEKIQEWAKENGLGDIIENQTIFARKDSSSKIALNKDPSQSGQSGETNLITPIPLSTAAPELNTVKNIFDLFFTFKIPTPLPTENKSSSSPISSISGIPIPTTSNSPGEPTRPPLAAIPDIDFAAYGLPPPKAEAVNGARGYNQLLNQLKSNSSASWAAKELLDAEKIARGKGVNVKPYITTAWIWFENGAAKWPDPYEMNCNDNRAGFRSEVNFFCNSKNFQVAGYQATSRSNDYVRIFRALYAEKELKNVMQRVIDNSNRASQGTWRYSGSVPSDISLRSIAPNSNFLSQQIQYYTLMLGKDPKMVVSLNSFAVSDGDLIRGLKNQACTYGYICATEKQVLSNMVAALYLFDTGSLPGSSSPGSGGGTSVANLDNFSHYCQCDSQFQSKGDRCICSSGCGLTSIAAGMNSLGVRTVPPEVRTALEGNAWNCAVGLYPSNALQSSFIRNKGFKAVMTNLTQGGRVNVNLARQFFEGQNKNRCFLLASSSELYHVFVISGINGNNLIVHDSYYGCYRGTNKEDPNYRIQPTSYASNYAYPVCKIN